MRRLFVDIIIAVVVTVIAGWWGTRYMRAGWDAGRRFGLPDEIAEPAVLAACGYGPHVAEHQPEALARFLDQRDDRLACDALPRSMKLSSQKLVRGTWLYLLLSVAAAWRLLGISWSGLTPLFGIVFGVTSACTYVLLRIAMGTVLAAVFTFAVSISSLNLLNLPGLRDYARAPFMLALIGIVLALGLRRWTTRQLLAVSAGAGAIAGVGYGFRADLLVQLPLFILTVLFFVRGHPKVRLLTKAASLGLATVTFAVVIWPLLRSTAQAGSNLWHIALIGLMPEYGTALGVENSTYHWGVTGSDEFIQLVIGDYARRMHPDWPVMELSTPQYERATRTYYLRYFPRFPADMITRVLASMSRIPELPFGWPAPPLAGVADGLYGARQRVLAPFYGWGMLVVGIALAAVIVARAHSGFFLLFVFAYVAGYPAIQFHNRHFFYLEVIGWLAIGFIASKMLRWARTRRLFEEPIRSRVAVANVGAAATLAAMLLVALLGLRSYQSHSMRRTIDAYLRASIHPLVLQQTDDEGRHTAAIPAFSFDSSDPHWARMLRVELNGARCHAATLTYQYSPVSPYRGLTTSVRLPMVLTEAPSDRIITFEPVYSGFSALEVRGADSGCLQSVGEVTGLDDEPLWLPLVLDPNWRRGPFYQTIRTRENIH